MGGLILDYTISSYKGIAVFQLVINGVGGNLVAVQASRISTSLHKTRRSGLQDVPAVRFSPLDAFFGQGKSIDTRRSVNSISRDIPRNGLQVNTQELPEFC